MANYYCSARSNYVRVKDVEAFKAWAERLGLEPYSRTHPDDGTEAWCVLCDGENSWPNFDPETGEEIDFVEEMAKHMQPGEVAVLIETGAEKLRYLVGQATAFDSNGTTISLDLNEIYNMACRVFHVVPTMAEY